MRIIGIDPGYAIVGYGIIDVVNSNNILVDYGVITTSPKKCAEKRLLDLYTELMGLLNEYEPDEAAMEKLFFNTNTTTGIGVAKACGVLSLALVQKNLPIIEYTPIQVKQTVVGYGNAEKKQIQYMVPKILNMKETPKPDDAADALAVAITHSHNYKINNLKNKG